MKDKKDQNRPKKLLALIRKEKDKAKLKIEKIQAHCYHQNKNGDLWVYRRKKHPDTCRCDECRVVIDPRWMDTDDNNEIRATVKEHFKAVDNILNTLKIQLSPKQDRESLDFIGDVQYGLKRAKRLAIACCADNFEPHKKKKNKHKKNKKKNKRGFRLGTGGRSIGFGGRRH
jgi:hypothetical protein